MSTHAARGRRLSSAEIRKARERRRTLRRRRVGGFLLLFVALGVGVVLLSSTFKHAVREITLPLEHADIIRQQAADKGLDPALIAAVIYTESRFAPRTSSAGAEGLMQITPETADFIAHTSGGTAFTVADLATPRVNIAYGAWYLRYELRRFGGNAKLALAAYNAGENNVDQWVAKAKAAGHPLGLDDIPFPETRAYVENVQQVQRDYRHHYASELGL